MISANSTLQKIRNCAQKMPQKFQINAEKIADL